MGFEYSHKIETMMEKKSDMMQEAWRYMPNILYSFAP